MIQKIKDFFKMFLPPPTKAFNREIERVLWAISQQTEYIEILEKKINILEENLFEQSQNAHIINSTILERISEHRNFSEKFLNRIPPTMIKNMEISICDHCNLNCQSCSHFACIAEKSFYHSNEMIEDIKRLSDLTQGVLSVLRVMGGEPLLHPNLVEILVHARTYFPHTYIRLVTNGLLLSKMDQTFWDCCREQNIVISPTKYPIALDYDLIEDIAREQNVSLVYYNNKNVVKTSHKLPLDLNGLQKPEKTFHACMYMGSCPMMKRGKIYPCPIAANIFTFNEKFNTNLQMTKNDFLILKEIESEEEIFEFLSKPIPFCRYCMMERKKWNIPWKQSTKKIEEWIP